MKVRADEHVSPKIVRALREVVLSPGWELSHVRDVHGARTADETWVPRFAAEGGKAIITADANMLKRPHQILAVYQSKIMGLILPHIWAVAKRHIQASSLRYFWPEIEALFSAGRPGDFFLQANQGTSGGYRQPSTGGRSKSWTLTMSKRPASESPKQIFIIAAKAAETSSALHVRSLSIVRRIFIGRPA